MAGPGAMIRATASLATPSTVSCPLELELITELPPEGTPQLVDTTYQSGSPDASTSLSVPIVRQGKRPTLSEVPQPVPVLPSLPVVLSKSPGFCGQGSAAGLVSH